MKTKNVLLVFFVVFIEEYFCDIGLLSKFRQKDYKMRNMRADLVEYNKDLINFLELKTFKYNRTTTAFNVTVNTKIDMSTEIEVVIQVYKFLSNEYRHFPIRIRLNACQTFAANVIGASSRIKLCGNVTRCFYAKGTTYRICNFTPDIEHLPPNIPTGEFMAEGEVFYLNVSVAKVRAYGEIYRPIYPKNKKG